MKDNLFCWKEVWRFFFAGLAACSAFVLGRLSVDPLPDYIYVNRDTNSHPFGLYRTADATFAAKIVSKNEHTAWAIDPRELRWNK